MAVNAVTCGSQAQVLREACGLIGSLPCGVVPFLVVGSHDEVLAWRHMVAATDAALAFGLGVTTLQHLVGSRWELHGDGRRVIDARQRLVLMARALEDAHNRGEAGDLAATPGVVRTLADAACEGYAHDGFAEQVARGACTQGGVFRVLSGYDGLLSAEGYIEYGAALWELARSEYPNVRLACIGFSDFLPAERGYLDAVDAVTFVCDPEPSDGDSRDIAALVGHLYRMAPALQPSSHVRVTCAAGVNAEVPLICKTIREYVAHGVAPSDIFVSSPQSSSLLEQVAPRLACEGIPVAGSTGMRFDSTLLGSAFLSLWEVVRALAPGHGGGRPRQVRDRRDLVAKLTGYALGPFCPVPSDAVWALDARMRSERTLPIGWYLGQLAEAGAESHDAGIAGTQAVRPSLAQVVSLLEGGRGSEALAELAEIGASSGRLNRLQQSLTSAALSAGAGFLDDATAAGISDALAMQLLAQIQVSCAVRLGASSGEGQAVRFGTMEGLALAGARVAIMCQLTSDAYTFAEKGDAVAGLLAQMGYQRADNRLAELRSTFKRACSAVTDTIVLERALVDADARPARPSLLFEEVIDCYREDVTATDDLDEATGVPVAWRGMELDGVALCEVEGEGCLPLLFPTAYGSRSACEDTRELVPVAGQAESPLDSSQVSRLLRRDGDEPVFSASQIELYLSCPYQWFISRKISPDALDTANDAPAFGSFAHKVLERFYREHVRRGCGRMTEDNLARATALLDEVFDDMRDNPPEELRNPLVIASELDFRQLEEWRVKLHGLLADDVVFLPRFAPESFERRFGYSEPVRYAGHLFRGSIDRIDTDGDGHAVIVDYKGSLGREYSPVERDGVLAVEHVQALIYAQVARRDLGLQVVGSLYRSYNKPEVQGLYDLSAIEIPEVFGRDAYAARPFSDGVGAGFADLLDRAEEGVAAAIERMEAGDISRSPAYVGSCRYCPVVSCGMRR